MIRRAAPRVAAVAVLVSAVVGCGDDTRKASAVSPADLAAARTADGEQLEHFCEATRGVRISWAAVVIDARRQFGDDYMESGSLLLDVGQPGDAAADAILEIRPSQVKGFTPGQAVTVIGILRGCEGQGPERVVRIEPLQVR